MGGGEGAAGALRRSFAGAGSSVSAGHDGVGEGGGGALLHSLGEEAEFCGKARGGVANGSEGGKGEEPELRG